MRSLLVSLSLGLLVGFALGRVLVATAPITLSSEVP